MNPVRPSLNIKLAILTATSMALFSEGVVAQIHTGAGPKLRAVHKVATGLQAKHRALMDSNGRITAVTGTIDELAALAQDPTVQAVELASPLRPVLAQRDGEFFDKHVL